MRENDANTPSSAGGQPPLTEMPEDVAILYSWANMPGAKYRDFSASRREFRAQQRVQRAERQRQSELNAARALETAAKRELEEAQRIRQQNWRNDAAGPDLQVTDSAKEAVLRAEEHAQREQNEAHRRQQSAEDLRLQAQRARNEMLEARRRAEEQASRYAEAAAQYREGLRAEMPGAVPGELTDPYYYTGQVDPAYFASTPGVRTAQAARVSTERRSYVYPMHPGSEDHDSGTLQVYQSNTTFAPSPSQGYRAVSSVPSDLKERLAPSEQSRQQKSRSSAGLAGDDSGYVLDDYYDGGRSTRLFKPSSRGRAGNDIGPNDQVKFLSPAEKSDSPVFTAGQSPVPVEDADLVVDQPIDLTVQRIDKNNAQAINKDIEAESSGKQTLAALGNYAEDSLHFVPVASAASAEEPGPLTSLSSEATGIVIDPILSEKPQPTSEKSLQINPPLQLRERVVPSDTRARTSRHIRPDNFAFSEAQDFYSDSSQIFHAAWPDQEQPSQKGKRETQTDGMDSLSILRASRRSARSPSQNRGASARDIPGGRGGYPSDTRLTNQVRSLLAERRSALPGTSDTRTRLEQAPGPDTLQQSRERVAARWFALNGEIEPAQELRTALGRMEVRTPALSVLSLSGGVGKTSIVATLGRALSSMGEKVLLADTNMHGLLPYYFGARDLRPGTVRTFTPPAGNSDAPVLLVNYEVEGVSGDEAGQRRILADIARRSQSSQRVIVDLGPGGAWLAKRLAHIWPSVLVPIAPDMNSVITTKAVERLFSDVADSDGYPVKPYYVLNQYDPTLPLHLDVREVLRQYLGERLLPVMLHRSPVVSEALAEGMTVIDYAPTAAVTEDYIHLANWLRTFSSPGSIQQQGVRWSER